MNDQKQLKLGAMLSYLSMASGYIIQIIYTPIMLRIIGQTQFGIFNLTNSIVSYLSLFSLGFGSAYVRFYMRHKMNDDEDGVARMNGVFMTVFLVMGALATIAGLVMVLHTKTILGSKFSSSELTLAQNLMALMVINIAISFPMIPYVSYIQANERFIFQNSLGLIRQFINPFLALPLLLMGYGSLGMVFATTVISIVISIAQFIYAHKKLSFKLSFKNMPLTEFKEIGVFSSFIFLNMLVDQINWNVDKFILGRFRGAVSVAVYGIATQLQSYYMNFASIVSSVFVPRVNKIVAQGGENVNGQLTNLFIKIGRVQFIILGLILSELIYLGKPFIMLWAGDGYAGAYTILLILIIPVTIPLIQNIGIEIQRAKNMHQFRSWVYLGIAVLNVVLSILLVHQYGGIGTAIGTAIALLIGNGLLMNWYYQARVGLDMWLFWKQIGQLAVPMAIVLFVGYGLTKLINVYSLFGFIGFGVIFFLMFSGLVWLMGMNNTEKAMFAGPVRRLLNR